MGLKSKLKKVGNKLNLTNTVLGDIAKIDNAIAKKTYNKPKDPQKETGGLHQEEGKKAAQKSVYDRGEGGVDTPLLYGPDSAPKQKARNLAKQAARGRIKDIPDEDEVGRRARKDTARKRSQRSGRARSILSQSDTLG